MQKEDEKEENDKYTRVLSAEMPETLLLFMLLMPKA